MADYFTNFSLLVPLPTEAAQKYALDLAQQAARIQQGDESAGGFPLREVVEDWQFETDADSSAKSWGLWLHSDYGGIDAVCAFIQHLLQRFAPGAHVTLEWSNGCSKPRVDAFGGGAALITARNIKTINTAEWLHREINRMARSKPSATKRKAA